MKSELLSLLYPRRCPICEDIVRQKEGLIHEECRQQLYFIKEPRCMKCGKPIEDENQEYCFDCHGKKLSYIKGFPCIKYDSNMSKSIAAFKYKSKKEYADFYVDEILKEYKSIFLRLQFDALVPVPIHVSKYKERGYNQAELIANGIGKQINVPVESAMLIRNRKTLPQKELNDKERLKNLQEAFEIRNEYKYSKYQRVLLVDDIYTTGSTVETCAKLLRTVGVGEVYYTSVCIGQGY